MLRRTLSDLAIASLHKAVREGNARAVARCLDEGADPQIPYDQTRGCGVQGAPTALGEVLLRLYDGSPDNCAEICTLLCESGADVNAPVYAGQSPNPTLTEALLARLSMPGGRNHADAFAPTFAAALRAGATATLRALVMWSFVGRQDVVELVLQNGGFATDDLNATVRFPFGVFTPLLAGVTSGSTEVVATLLSAGATPDHEPPAAPIETDRATLLEYGVSPAIQSPAAPSAAETSHTDSVSPGARVVASGGASGELHREVVDTPLAAAVEQGSAELVQMLLAAGANANAPRRDGTRATPLGLAAALALVHEDTCIQIMDRLLVASADVNKTNAFGESPMRIAIMNDNLWALPLLLDAGAHVFEGGDAFTDITGRFGTPPEGVLADLTWLRRRRLVLHATLSVSRRVAEGVKPA